MHVLPAIVKAALWTWNKSIFGDIFSNIKKQEDRVLETQLKYDMSGLPDDRSVW
jgi:hypothetical protein